jgi:hypothetical protein
MKLRSEQKVKKIVAVSYHPPKLKKNNFSFAHFLPFLKSNQQSINYPCFIQEFLYQVISAVILSSHPPLYAIIFLFSITTFY